MLQVLFFITYYLHKKLESCKIWSFDSSVAEDPVLLGCYGLAVQDVDCLTLKLKALWSFETTLMSVIQVHTVYHIRILEFSN